LLMDDLIINDGSSGTMNQQIQLMRISKMGRLAVQSSIMFGGECRW